VECRGVGVLGCFRTEKKGLVLAMYGMVLADVLARQQVEYSGMAEW